MLLTFDRDVDPSALGLIVTGGTVSTTIANGNQLIATITNITNGQCTSIRLTGIQNENDVFLKVGSLVGDVDGNKLVSSEDVILTKAQIGQFLNASTAKYDVTLNGSINLGDTLLVNSRLGNQLVSCS